jgi:hypothetical protein
VWSNSLSSDIHRKTNKKGEVAASLKPGLYLVMIDQYTQGDYTYSATPFMAFLPGFNEEKNVWNYNVTAYPKVSAVDSSDHIYSYLEGENPTEDSSESPKSNGDHSDSTYSNPVSENPTEDSGESLVSKDAPSDSILPQTGLLWWPVLPLFAIGLLFLVIGLFRRRGRED